VDVRSFKGLVNAVLRRMAEEGPELVAAQDAARMNTPQWLWESWVKAHGGNRARAIASSHLHEAPLDISVKSDPDRWAGLLSGTRLPTGTIRRAAGGMVTDLPGFADGTWWIQDFAAALPARLLGPVDGLRVLDMCAAPGGKTAQLAAAGAVVTAVDRSAKRLNRVRQNLDRLGLGAELVASDAMLLQPSELYDAVLLDAPCSATGTIRRHPDIPHTKGPQDVSKLAAAQRALLGRAVDLVKPGGLIVWCTCSLQPEEGERQVDTLIRSGAPVERVPIGAEEIGGLHDAVTAKGDVRTLPYFSPLAAGEAGADGGRNRIDTGVANGGMDGFHIARLRRR
jgi:16S rRNA (cytosine967-C5)-methyltransferase